MRIMAFDPGSSTGVATIRADRVPLSDGKWEFDSFQLTGEHHDDLWRLLENMNPDVVVSERFNHRFVGSAVLDSVEYIGVLRLWCQRNERTLFEQSPASAKNLFTDSKVKTLEMYKPGSVHANDATRHILYYLSISHGDKYFIRKLNHNNEDEGN